MTTLKDFLKIESNNFEELTLKDFLKIKRVLDELGILYEEGVFEDEDDEEACGGHWIEITGGEFETSED